MVPGEPHPKLWEHQPDARAAGRTRRIHQKRRGDGGHAPIAGHFPHIARCAGFIIVTGCLTLLSSYYSQPQTGYFPPPGDPAFPQ